MATVLVFFAIAAIAHGEPADTAAGSARAWQVTVPPIGNINVGNEEATASLTDCLSPAPSPCELHDVEEFLNRSVPPDSLTPSATASLLRAEADVTRDATTTASLQPLLMGATADPIPTAWNSRGYSRVEGFTALNGAILADTLEAESVTAAETGGGTVSASGARVVNLRLGSVLSSEALAPILPGQPDQTLLNVAGVKIVFWETVWEGEPYLSRLLGVNALHITDATTGADIVVAPARSQGTYALPTTETTPTPTPSTSPPPTSDPSPPPDPDPSPPPDPDPSPPPDPDPSPTPDPDPSPTPSPTPGGGGGDTGGGDTGGGAGSGGGGGAGGGGGGTGTEESGGGSGGSGNGGRGPRSVTDNVAGDQLTGDNGSNGPNGSTPSAGADAPGGPSAGDPAERGPTSPALPYTGAPVTSYLALSLNLMIAGGLALVLHGRRLSVNLAPVALGVPALPVEQAPQTPPTPSRPRISTKKKTTAPRAKTRASATVTPAARTANRSSRKMSTVARSSSKTARRSR